MLEVGDLRFRLIGCPGHSPGGLVAYEPDAREALVGDIVFAQGIGRTDFPGSDHDAMMATLTRLFDELPGQTRIYPGHGPWGGTLAEAQPFARMFM